MTTDRGRQDQDNVTVIEARASDIDSLKTIVARSFHPVNPYIRACFPDTPAVSKWWFNLFEGCRKDPSSHVLIALDPATDQDIAVLMLRYREGHERDAGLWTDPAYAWPADVDSDLAMPMMDSMAKYEAEFMAGKPHYLIELFGTDQQWKGKGVGTKLLQRVCEIADAKGVEVFVQAGPSAVGFYKKMAFSIKATKTMPGGEYTETMMVRTPNAGA